jgi:hypothetical protein
MRAPDDLTTSEMAGAITSEFPAGLFTSAAESLVGEMLKLAGNDSPLAGLESGDI